MFSHTCLFDCVKPGHALAGQNDNLPWLGNKCFGLRLLVGHVFVPFSQAWLRTTSLGEDQFHVVRDLGATLYLPHELINPLGQIYREALLP